MISKQLVSYITYLELKEKHPELKVKGFKTPNQLMAFQNHEVTVVVDLATYEVEIEALSLSDEYESIHVSLPKHLSTLELVVEYNRRFTFGDLQVGDCLYLPRADKSIIICSIGPIRSPYTEFEQYTVTDGIVEYINRSYTLACALAPEWQVYRKGVLIEEELL